MGKAKRLKAVNATKKPQILGTIGINLMSDGNVSVSGPIADPGTVGKAIGQAIHALIVWHAQQAKEGSEKRILTPGGGLILSG